MALLNAEVIADWPNASLHRYLTMEVVKGIKRFSGFGEDGIDCAC
jgi:hypothetical protein